MQVKAGIPSERYIRYRTPRAGKNKNAASVGANDGHGGYVSSDDEVFNHLLRNSSSQKMRITAVMLYEDRH